MRIDSQLEGTRWFQFDLMVPTTDQPSGHPVSNSYYGYTHFVLASHRSACARQFADAYSECLKSLIQFPHIRHKTCVGSTALSRGSFRSSAARSALDFLVRALLLTALESSAIMRAIPPELHQHQNLVHSRWRKGEKIRLTLTHPQVLFSQQDNSAQS